MDRPSVPGVERGSWEYGAVSGILALVGTPIGNLGDISPRAAQALADADLICCEDTRRTRTLLSEINIPAGSRLISLHEHNEQAKAQRIVDRVKAGDSVVVVSDAGMPGISDPGSILVAVAAEQGCGVTVIPGPSAVLGALVISGLPSERFVMEGFLPRKGRERRSVLEDLSREGRTSVIFESPHRLVDTLKDLASLGNPERLAVVVRELTKIHEEVRRGSLTELVAHFSESPPRGEIVLILRGSESEPKRTIEDAEIIDHLNDSLAAGMSKRDAASAAAAELKVPRSRAYELASSLPR